jgi:hypothetical protein
MPLSYRIDKQQRLVASRISGNFTVDDALEFRRQIVADADFDPSFAELLDFSGVSKMDITPREVRMLAGTNIFSPDSRRAIVAEDPLVFGLGRIFETLRTLRGDRHIRVFHTRDQALTWIFLKDRVA